MKELDAINATDVRKDWGAFIDSVVRKKPKFIKRSRDHIFAASTDMLKEMLREYKLTATVYKEENETITAVLEEIDIVSNGNTKEDVLNLLAADLREYAEEYYREFEYWYNAPNRKAHLPYILKILLLNETKDILDMIECRDGKN
jgi:ribonucleotide monophosphatase NagD (HAD superfamily)